MQSHNSVSEFNIHENKKRLVLRALNTFSTKKMAAEALGITERSLYTYIDDFNIVRDVKEFYFASDSIKDKPKMVAA